METIDIARLSPKERLDLISELWDSLSPEDLRLTPAQAAEIASRMTTFDADRQDAVAWDEIDAEFDHAKRGASSLCTGRPG